MKLIYEALETCDVVVLGSPVYFDTVSAQTKLMIDRCNCLMPFVKSSCGTSEFKRRIEKRKKGIFIAVAGTDQEYDTILTTASGFFCWANIELIDKILYSHDTYEIGDVRDNKEIMTHAYEIGVRFVKQ